MPTLEAFGKSGGTTIDVTGYDPEIDSADYYSIEISQEDLDIEFGSIYPPSDLKLILANAVAQVNAPGKAKLWSHLAVVVIRDTEFDDRYWISNGSNSNSWRLKRTPQQIHDLIEALRAAIKDFNRP